MKILICINNIIYLGLLSLRVRTLRGRRASYKLLGTPKHEILTLDLLCRKNLHSWRWFSVSLQPGPHSGQPHPSHTYSPVTFLQQNKFRPQIKQVCHQESIKIFFVLFERKIEAQENAILRPESSKQITLQLL